MFVGYWHAQKQGIAPLFRFGHGLSCTGSVLRGLTAEARGSGGTARVGSTVVQLRVGDPEASLARPIRRFRLDPDETREVIFDLGARRWRGEAGRFVSEAGLSTEDNRTRAEVVLVAAELAPGCRGIPNSEERLTL